MKRSFLSLLLLFPTLIFGVIREECEFPTGVIDPCEPTCVLPKASPIVCDAAGGFVFADFIYWTARTDGLGFAASGQAANPGLVNPSKGKIYHPDEVWRPGFKAGAGAYVTCDGWDVTAIYTYLQVHNTKNTVSAPSDPNTTLRSMWATQVVPDGFLQNQEVDKASGRWSLKFNVLDLEIGRNFCLSPKLSIRPYFGGKGTWQDQDFDVVYHGIALSSSSTGRVKILQDQEFIGGGIRTGVQPTFMFASYFSLFGNVAISSVWGQFDICRRNKQKEDEPGAAEVQTLNQYNRFHTNKAVLEFQLGLRFDIPFYCNRFNFRLQASYEEQHWFSQNQFIKLVEESAHGDLVMQGLTLEGRFDF